MVPLARISGARSCVPNDARLQSCLVFWSTRPGRKRRVRPESYKITWLMTLFRRHTSRDMHCCQPVERHVFSRTCDRALHHDDPTSTDMDLPHAILCLTWLQRKQDSHTIVVTRSRLKPCSERSPAAYQRDKADRDHSNLPSMHHFCPVVAQGCGSSNIPRALGEQGGCIAHSLYPCPL